MCCSTTKPESKEGIYISAQFVLSVSCNQRGVQEVIIGYGEGKGFIPQGQ